MSTSALASSHSSNDRLIATLAHVGTLFSWFVAPLVIYLVLPRDSRWLRMHALQSLLWSLLGTLVSLATCGLAIPIFLVWHVIAAWKTFHDGDYFYPLVGEAARDAVFKAS